jgi:hypothetical protein
MNERRGRNERRNRRKGRIVIEKASIKVAERQVYVPEFEQISR